MAGASCRIAASGARRRLPSRREARRGSVRLAAAAEGRSPAGPAGESEAVRALEALLARSCDEEEGCVAPPRVVFAEADGVLVDVHTDVHRVAFNAAFAAFGLDCANWTPEVYADLLRTGDGTPETFLTHFFERTGWPAFLPPQERAAFVEKVIEKKRIELHTMVRSRQIRLRPGAREFVQEILDAEPPVELVVIPATMSAKEERIVDAVVELLVGPDGHDRVAVLGERGDDRLEPGEIGRLAVESVARQKEQLLQSAAETLGGRALSPSVAFSHARMALLPGTLRGCAEAYGVETTSCAFVAASESTANTARAAGLGHVAVMRTQLSRGGVFPAAGAVYDDFGAGGGLTLARICRALDEPTL